MSIIEIKNLKKSYQMIKAVDDITFEVREGELFAFLGLNGAGKSTTISIICGLLQKDGGDFLVDGLNLDKSLDQIKHKIGIVFQNSALDKVLTVKENLKTRASLYGITGEKFANRLKEICEMLELDEILNRQIGKLSGGQRRRADVARALFHNPKILILDEPTTGLDPKSRIMVWNVIERLRRKAGLTVFLTTHYMEEASEADYVVILESGKIVAKGTPLELKNQFSGDYVKIYNIDSKTLDNINLKYQIERNYVKIRVQNMEEARELIIKYPFLFNDFEIIKGGMDDVFLAATSQSKEELKNEQ